MCPHHLVNLILKEKKQKDSYVGSCGGNTNIEEADGQLSEGYEIEELYRVGSKFDEDIHIVVLQHLWHIPEIEHLLLQASSSSLVPVHHTNNFFPYVMQVSVQLL